MGGDSRQGGAVRARRRDPIGIEIGSPNRSGRRMAPPPTLTASVAPNVGGAAVLRLSGKSADGTASHIEITEDVGG